VVEEVLQHHLELVEVQEEQVELLLDPDLEGVEALQELQLGLEVEQEHHFLQELHMLTL